MNWNYRFFACDFGLTELDPENPLGTLMLVEAVYQGEELVGISEVSLLFDSLETVETQLEWMRQAKSFPVLILRSKYSGEDLGVKIEVLDDKKGLQTF